jgi:hypothetical protein
VSHFAVIREAGPGWKVGGITGSEHGRVRVLLIVDAESDAEIHHRLADDPWVPTDNSSQSASSRGSSSSAQPSRRRNAARPTRFQRCYESEQASGLVSSQSASGPTVAAVAALPELAVGKAGEQATIGGEERVGHRRQRLRQPACERLPRLIAAPPIDARLRVAAATSGERAGAR